MSILLALLLQTAPQIVDVVVTARPIGELRIDWEACLAGRCTPQHEMRRALVYAEAQVMAGDYRGGWATLRTAKGRNWRYAETLPVPVARVVKASARLAGLNGQPLASRVGMIDGVDALKKGLESEDARVLVARLDIADAFIPEQRVDAALDQYRRVEKDARDAKLPAVAAMARYRYAMLLTGLATTESGRDRDGTYYGTDARRELARIAASDDPAMAEYRDSARLVALNFLPERKRLAAVDAVLPTLAPRPADSLVLAYAPAIDLRRVVVGQSSAGEAQQWADIAFRIAPNGRVTDVVPIKRSSHLAQGWLDRVTKAIGERRYVPLQLPPDDPGVRHAARVTFVLDETSATGSRLAQRNAQARVDIVDLGELITPS